MAEAREVGHDSNGKKIEVESREGLQGKAFTAVEFLKKWSFSALNDYDKTKLSDVEEALSTLNRFKEAVREDRAQKKDAKQKMLGRIEEVLNTPRGRAVQKARDVFTDFDEEVDIPRKEDHDAYRISVYDDYRLEDIDLDDKDYDPDGVLGLQIGHLALWGDGDYDYGGGHTQVNIKLDAEGKIVYEFSGDELDQEFKKKIEGLIRKKAEKI